MQGRAFFRVYVHARSALFMSIIKLDINSFIHRCMALWMMEETEEGKKSCLPLRSFECTKGSNSPLFTVVVEIDDAFENTFAQSIDTRSAAVLLTGQVAITYLRSVGIRTTEEGRRLFDVLFGSGVWILLFFFAIRYFFKLTEIIRVLALS